MIDNSSYFELRISVSQLLYIVLWHKATQPSAADALRHGFAKFSGFLPRSFLNARDLAFVSQLTEADTADAVFS
jgi:hypothetical protein